MHYKIEVLVESDREEEQLGMFVEGVLAQHRWHFKVKDLSLYEVTHMPGWHFKVVEVEPPTSPRRQYG